MHVPIYTVMSIQYTYTALDFRNTSLEHTDCWSESLGTTLNMFSLPAVGVFPVTVYFRSLIQKRSSAAKR